MTLYSYKGAWVTAVELSISTYIQHIINNLNLNLFI